MGCGGSKQDVATGNTVSRRNILRKASSSSAAKSKSSSSTYDEIKQKTDEANRTGAGVEQAQVSGAKLASKESSSEEYFSSRREMESLEMATEYLSPNEDYSSSDRVEKTTLLLERSGSRSGGEVSVSISQTEAMVDKSKTASSEPKHENEEIGIKEDDGESIGKHSMDFKEAISIDEAQPEVAVLDKKNSEENKKIVS